MNETKEKKETQEELDQVEALLRAYRPLVYARARRFGPRMAKDEDLLQCGMIGLWRAAERWDGVTPFPALATPCIDHAMVDHLRWLARKPRTAAADPADLPSRFLVTHTDFSAVEYRLAICQTLPPDSEERRLLLELLDGASLGELARRLGRRPYRLRARLRAALALVEGDKAAGQPR